VASDFASALDDCFASGGHLPTSTELVSLVLEGLPVGSNALFTADHRDAGYRDPVDNTVTPSSVFGVLGGGLPGRFAYGQDLEHVAKSASASYRCLRYPIDPDFKPPADELCLGGCTLVQSPEGGVRLWFDTENRGGKTTHEALDECTQTGARLATMRDLLEAVRHGLTFEPSTLLTAEIVFPLPDDPPIGTNNLLMLKNPTKDFDLAHPDNFEQIAFGATRSFRCLWTNEIR
jgi:hypothetical protein